MSSQSLKEKTAKGFIWAAFNNGAQQVLNLIIGIFLGRLLSPADYGMAGLLQIFTLIASALQESGFIAGLANRKEVRHEDYNAVFWFSICISAIIYVILFFLAPYITLFYEKSDLTGINGLSDLTPLARYTFLGFFIASFGIAHRAHLFRTLQVKKHAIVSIVSLTLSGITGITMAYYGYAYWGIATQGLVFVASNDIMFWWMSGWRPTFNFSFKPLKEMFGFSSKLLITNITIHINNNILTVILGRFYSIHEVGLFNQANKWNSMGYSTVNGMVSGVAQPVLRNVIDDQERQKRVFRKMLRFTAFVCFPAMFGLSLVATELISITITDKWIESAKLLQMLCIGGAFIPLQTLFTNLIISEGRSDTFLYSTATLGILQIITALFCHSYGLQTMIVAYVCINIIWLFVWHYLAHSRIRLTLFETVKDILPFAFIAGIVMLITAMVASYVPNIWMRFITKIILAAALYCGVMWISGSSTFKESMEYIFKKKKDSQS